MNSIFKVGSKSTSVEYDTENDVLVWDNHEEHSAKIHIPIVDVFGVKSEGNTWTLSYVRKTPEKWIPVNVTFSSDGPDVCVQWTKYIQEAISNTGQERPKRLLVFINPDGGFKRGVQNYNNIVKPLFQAAGITDDVIVTEDGGHAGRVLLTYDLTAIDGVVAVGGDGMFMHVMTAVMKRLMNDAGRDIDDPDEKLITTDLRIGLLPAGTGQALVRMFTGMRTADYPTSALCIIFGDTLPGKLLSIHHNNKLVYYSALQCLFGMLGDLIENTERYRWMGAVRYIVWMFAMFVTFSQSCVDKVKLSVLVHKDGSNMEEWVTSTGVFKGIDAFAFGFPTQQSKHKAMNYLTDTIRLHAVAANASRRTYYKIFKSFTSNADDTMYESPELTKYDAKAFKMELPTPSEGSNGYHVLNLDGDPFKVGAGLVHVKLHTNVFRVFGTRCDLSEDED